MGESLLLARQKYFANLVEEQTRARFSVMDAPGTAAGAAPSAGPYAQTTPKERVLAKFAEERAKRAAAMAAWKPGYLLRRAAKNRARHAAEVERYGNT